MSIVSQKMKAENRFVLTVDNFFKKFSIASILKESNAYKEKGIPCVQVFKVLFRLAFTGKNLFMNYEAENPNIPFARDVAYRFLNSMHINWQRFLYSLSAKVINHHIDPLTADNRADVFVIDDSFYSRTRSKAVELLCWVKDHADGNKNKKGFRMLTLGWTDGNSFIPVAFNLLSSANAKVCINPARESIDKRTVGFKRRKNALSTSPDSALAMLKQAIAAGIKAKYVLFDSWFSFPATIIKVCKMNLDVIAMLKDTPKIYYTFNGEKKSLREIYRIVRKRRGRAKYLASVMVELHDKEGNSLPAKIVFVRDRRNKSKWLALISTDIDLPETEIIRIYGKRWDIEVFFKMCKSYLKLAKEFQGRSYDMMVAHTTIVFSRYIMLAVENRNNTDLRTIGALFYYCCDELEDIKFLEALQLIIEALKTA
ncbi:IS4 family transposase, partial [Thermotalea metallivorans]|uniref:IS4 family transposase n=1 Tax=Thermotalea metallivorans TaxID=520762 RepID=UPI0008392F23